MVQTIACFYVEGMGWNKFVIVKLNTLKFYNINDNGLVIDSCESISFFKQSIGEGLILGHCKVRRTIEILR